MDQLAQDLLLFMGVPLSDDKDETETTDHEEITEEVDEDEIATEVAPELIVVDAESGEL